MLRVLLTLIGLLAGTGLAASQDPDAAPPTQEWELPKLESALEQMLAQRFPAADPALLREALRNLADRLESEVALEAELEGVPVGESFDSVWEYMASRYDSDGDQQITGSEYNRGEDVFASLDRDDDGALTEADFNRSGRGFGDFGGGMSGDSMAQRIVSTLLRGEAEGEEGAALSLDEVGEAFVTADLDEDEILARCEFGPLLEARGQDLMMISRMMDDADTYEILLSAMDEDEDGEIARDELVDFFDAQDEDGDGVWADSGDRMRPRGRFGAGLLSGFRRGGGSRDTGERDRGGAPEGAVAPDFTLKNLSDEAPVTLSAFAGDRPVALIFGSYT